MAGDLGHQEEAMVSWEADPKKGEEGVDGGDVDGKGPVILESMLFKDDAKEVGIVEVRYYCTILLKAAISMYLL